MESAEAAGADIGHAVRAVKRRTAKQLISVGLAVNRLAAQNRDAWQSAVSPTTLRFERRMIG
jgi:hypothetical protein